MSRPPTSDNPHAVYQRAWRAKNAEKAREINRASRERAIAADPDAFKERARERYQAWLAKPGNRERDRQRKRDQKSGWRKTRRGLTAEDRHVYWLFQGGLCDLCKQPYPDPATGSWRDISVDHDHTHCWRQAGCVGCVRGQGHRVCNTLEGAIGKAVRMGMLTGYTGPLVDYLSDPPFQKWYRARA